MENENFIVFGDENLLKNCKINISKIYSSNKQKTETLLFNGKTNNIKTDLDAVYKMYFSYNDTLVSTLKMENIFYGASDQINHFYIQKKEDAITVMFVGREADLKKGQGFKTILIPLDEYFKTENIFEDKLKTELKDLFFNEYK